MTVNVGQQNDDRIVVGRGQQRVYLVGYAIMKTWQLSHTGLGPYVCVCGERQNMSHLMPCGDALNCTWTDVAMPTLAGVNCAKHGDVSTVTIDDSMKK